MTPVDRPIIVLGVFLMLSGWVSEIFLIGVLVMLLDIRARLIEYREIRGIPFSAKLVQRRRVSWCGRGVCEFVWPYKARLLYSSMGYRWYHILPDGFPGVFLSIAFWRHVIGWDK